MRSRAAVARQPHKLEVVSNGSNPTSAFVLLVQNFNVALGRLPALSPLGETGYSKRVVGKLGFRLASALAEGTLKI